eukprot:TRINITY_DN24648_c0_g1_i1.p1 TRINITY_DN24648_c0_g1~~TRINITY_DN24648_c0_g1_i1.p1  ORF type:complete len:302 (+),score=32.76 TRINITY_DN24648_c0_g1_i1:48-953(+)
MVSDASAHDVLLWDLLLTFGLACVGFGLYGVVCQRRRRLQGPTFLLVYGSVCIASSLAGGCSLDFAESTRRFPHLPFGSWSIFFGGMWLTVLLLIRLFACEQFGGSPFDLDFGLQWCAKKGVRPCIAMKPRCYTYGHAAQGMLSFFLFPVAEYTLMTLSPSLALLFRGVSVLVVVYPLYNLKKRLTKHNAYFAISSFFHNCADWSIGFLMGACLGVLHREEWNAEPGFVREQIMNVGSSKLERAWDLLEWARFVAGCLLIAATMRATLQLWRTWDERPEFFASNAQNLSSFEPLNESSDDE